MNDNDKKQRPVVLHLASNVKAATPWEVDLGMKTLILGPNGSGKSARVQALELALTGEVTDLAGKQSVSREQDLFTLAPGREGTLFARALLSDGSTAEWTSTGSTEKAKRAKHTVPAAVTDGVFPLRGLRAAFAGVETARKFFLSQLSGVSMEDVKRQFSAGDLERVEKVLTAASDPVQGLLAVLQRSAERKREAQAEFRAAEKVVDAQGSGLAPEPSDAQLAEWQAKAEQLSEDLHAAGSMDDVSGEITRLGDELTEQRAQLQARIATMKEQGIRPDSVKPVDALRKVLAAAQLHVDKGFTSCLVCGQEGEVDFPERVAAVQGQVAGRLRAAEMVDRYKALKVSIAQAETQLEALRGRAQVRHVTGDPAQIREELAQLRSTLDKAHALRGQWAAVRKARDQVSIAQRAVADWQAVHDACERALATVLDGGTAQLVRRVQQFLPESDQFYLRLRDGEREVCEYGFRREGVAHRALSGAEWARMQAAMAAAFAPPTGVSVIVPEDRSWDPQTLSKVLIALSAADGQVVIATTTEPVAIPDGWTVVRLGQVEAPIRATQLQPAELA